MVGLIVSLVSGILGAVVALLARATWPLPLLVGGIVASVLFVALVTFAYRGALREQAGLPVAFPRDAAAPPKE